MARIEILKTYKLYIGGQFPRTESGRYYTLLDKKNKVIADICLGSRKDFRNAVVAARAAFGAWSGRTAYNRAQILYRIAEMLETRKAQFIVELIQQGSTKINAEKEVALAVDRLVYYAGWCDKFQQIFSSVNPVASSHFNFSVPEPTGVVAVVAPQDSSLIGLVSIIAPIIAGGNVCIALASEKMPLCSITFAEVLATSDLAAGVVNILTGKTSELISHMSSHMDVNAVVYAGKDQKEILLIKENATLNVKRVFVYQNDWNKTESQNPYFIFDAQEIKTTWHPIESIGVGGAKY
ncbi:MAG: aldehyde dehydrogenase family protein [Bacteroidetes bacterium]|nr:aldehyde dehydrogenase family protein [Bacteroidota bacterium]PHX82589.1 MAG: aldehyde dehydrogenase [Flavobacteriales bacterium]